MYFSASFNSGAKMFEAKFLTVKQEPSLLLNLHWMYTYLGGTKCKVVESGTAGMVLVIVLFNQAL